MLAKIREIDADRIRQALEQTFAFRKTHGLPASMPEPSASWAEVYRRMAEEDDLEWKTLPALVTAGKTFLDPVLTDAEIATWIPTEWLWTQKHG